MIRFFFALFLIAFPLRAQELPFTLPITVSGITGYDPKIPTPEQVLGVHSGSRHLRPDEVVRYAEAVDRASDRVTLQPYGRSYEGRPLLVAIITTPDQHAHLNDIKQQHQRLFTAPDQVSDAELSTMPAVFYAGYSVHGNEASGTEAGVLFLYHLAAAQGAEFEAKLRNLVILLDPCFNPDGRARFVDWVNRMRGGTPNADPADAEHVEPWPTGRTNKYWFDLNRDWFVAVHPESRGRVDLFYEWRPQLLTDHHEMGSEATFFFQPGIPASTNPNTPQGNIELTERLAEYHARYLDQIGSLYYSKESFDDFYYGKGSTFPDVNGSVGILFEQASSRALQRETQDGILNFDFTVRNHFMTSVSSFEGLSTMRVDFLRHTRNFYREAAAIAAANPVKAYVLKTTPYPNRTAALVNTLLRHKIRIYHDAGGQDLIVPMNQPQVRLLKGVMEKVTTFRDSLFYDISTWTMPIAHGVPYTESAMPVALGTEITAPVQVIGKRIGGEQPYAYLVRWGDYYAPRALYRLLAAGIPVRLAKAPFKTRISNQELNFDQGTLVIPTTAKDPALASALDTLPALMEVIRTEDGLDVWAAHSGFTPEGPDFGSNMMEVLSLPKVAMLIGNGVNAHDAGEAWHLFSERMHIPLSLLDAAEAGRPNLDRYNVILLSDGQYSAAWAEKLKTWIANGGTLVAMSGAAQWAIRNNLIDEKMKDVPGINLSKVPYADLARTRGAQDIAGAIFDVQLDPTHPLAFGYGKTVQVFRNSERFFMPSAVPGANVGLYTAKPRVSGYVSDEMLAQIPQTAALLARKSGKGGVVLMADNPNFRAFWYGTNGLMLNAVFFGHNF